VGIPEVFPGRAEGPLPLSVLRDGAWAVFEEGVVVLDGLDFFGLCEGLACWDGEGRVGLWHVFCDGCGGCFWINYYGMKKKYFK
jgi:hypothetical protein